MFPSDLPAWLMTVQQNVYPFANIDCQSKSDKNLQGHHLISSTFAIQMNSLFQNHKPHPFMYAKALVKIHMITNRLDFSIWHFGIKTGVIRLFLSSQAYTETVNVTPLAFLRERFRGSGKSKTVRIQVQFHLCD